MKKLHSRSIIGITLAMNSFIVLIIELEGHVAGFSQRLMRMSGWITATAITREIMQASRVAADGSSFLQLSLDVLLFRVLRLIRIGVGRERTVRFGNGTVITYRLNRGDIQGIKEVWFNETYRLPFDTKVNQIVDLGANIGLTSVYFFRKYGAAAIVAVEPNPANANLVKRNFEQNGIPGHVIEAAVGPEDGIAHFADAADSNLGHLSDTGREVRIISMPTLCSQYRMDSIDLLKIDIEGAEQALLSGPTEWIGNVGAIIAEFHPGVVNYPALADEVAGKGFHWVRPGSVHKHTTDAFIRNSPGSVSI